MNSFQQIAMGVVCLGAAFALGAYLQDQPAGENRAKQLLSDLTGDSRKGSIADSSAEKNSSLWDGLFAFKNSDADSGTSGADPNPPRSLISDTQGAGVNARPLGQLRGSNFSSAPPQSDPPPALRSEKFPVVPDFSDLAKSFRRPNRFQPPADKRSTLPMVPGPTVERISDDLPALPLPSLSAQQHRSQPSTPVVDRLNTDQQETAARVPTEDTDIINSLASGQPSRFDSSVRDNRNTLPIETSPTLRPQSSLKPAPANAVTGFDHQPVVTNPLRTDRYQSPPSPSSQSVFTSPIPNRLRQPRVDVNGSSSRESLADGERRWDIQPSSYDVKSGSGSKSVHDRDDYVSSANYEHYSGDANQSGSGNRAGRSGSSNRVRSLNDRFQPKTATELPSPYVVPPRENVAANSTDAGTMGNRVRAVRPSYDTTPMNVGSAPQRVAPVPPESVLVKPRSNQPTDRGGRRQSETSLQKSTPVTIEYSGFRFHTTREDDSLQTLSEYYYGTPEYYFDLYLANRDKLTNPANVPVGIQIKIPNMNPR